MHRRQFIQRSGLGLLASQLPHWSFAADSPLQTVWGAPVAPSVLLGVAARQGALHRKHPYSVKIWKTPDQLRAGLANGSMPVTMVPSYVGANVANRGQDVVLLNIMTFGLLQMVARDMPMNNLGELEGKSLVMPFKNDMPDLVLQILCKRAGVDFDKITVQYVATPPEALTLFLKNRADYAFLPEPLTSVAIMKGKQSGQNVVRVLDFQQEWGRIMNGPSRIPQAGMLIDRAFYAEHQTIIDQLHEDIASAVVWTQENPQSAAEIASAYLPVPKPILSTALPHANLTATRSQDISEEIMLFFEEMYALNPKILGGKMPSDTLFHL
ncbi:ABC transporter substrate-binding protein [Suttonella sp. R2A3]|uniref:ABC transporter substrate-binding protein n=1 Tax=Suttonella sp. R2A3 TaxID=2908648 RepID=UPI001F44D56A|nr:ABC transporter substrate-binding protein [Suttonella sp. R2A3]UJF25132.1 ABC transporter substrate-binding protein [Suttonella sp. R2A3]